VSETGYSDYEWKALQVAQLVEKKQLAYGNSFGESGEVLRILYPDGFTAGELDDVLTIVRIIDKLFRVANQKDAFDENPWQDIMGYALLALTRDSKE
jgi:hypothetical protein